MNSPSLLHHLDASPEGPLQILPLRETYDRQETHGEAWSKSLALSLIIPTFNEGQNLAPLIARLTRLLEAVLPNDYELIVVDDDSPDGTWEQALALADQFPHLRVMRRRQERGLSSAVVRGWQVARGRVLGVIDADLQHPPEVVLPLWDGIQAGADLTVGSRHVDGGGVSQWSPVRRLLSRGAQTLGLLVLPQVVGRVSDPMSGFFMVRREAIAGPILNPKGYKILLEILGRGNIHTISEVGYVFQERVEGASKVTWRQYIDYIHHLLRLRLGGRLSQVSRGFPLKRFVKFVTVGFSGLFVDFTVFYLLFGVMGLGLTTSNMIAAEFGILNNFLWNDAWTFSDLVLRQQGWRARVKRLLKFNVICLAGLLLNTLTVNLLFNVFGMNAYLAKLIAIVAVAVWNFWLNLKLNWRVTQVKD